MSFRLMSALALSAALLSPSTASAYNEDGGWMLGGRVLSISPNDSSGELDDYDDSGVKVDSAVSLGLDLSYFFNEHWALEFNITSTEHEIRGTGSISDLGRIADVKILPTSLLAEYHFNSQGKVKPYLGLGFAYTVFHDEDTTSSLDEELEEKDGSKTALSLGSDFGWVAQFGLDVQLNENWFLNFDVKYMDIDSTASFDSGDDLRKIDISFDPWVPAVGVGYRW